MSSSEANKTRPEGDGAHPKGTRIRHFRGYWNIENTKEWVEMFTLKRMSAVAIGETVGADPSTVTTWLRKHGVRVYAGLHRIDREPPRISQKLNQLLGGGPEETMKFLDERVWGIFASQDGFEQLSTFCKFLKLPLETGVKDVAHELGVHRSTILMWTQGTDLCYLARAADTALHTEAKPGYKLLPLRLAAGGNKQQRWIQAPTGIRSHQDILAILDQTKPLDETYMRAERFGISRDSVNEMRPEFLAYLLGMTVGDSGKEGGKQVRFASMRLDLHLSMKEPTNELLGEFVCLCANSLGISMNRVRDKPPTGATRRSKKPSAAYRWASESSPLLAWMFFVCLGLEWDQLTSYDQVRMEWILDTPAEFRKRFVQGMADSDGTVRYYVVEITSVPNSEFVTRLLHSLGLHTAYARDEDGVPMRTVVKNTEAAHLPIFNEFAQTYRYKQLLDIE